MHRKISTAFLILALAAIHASPLVAQERSNPSASDASRGLETPAGWARWWTLTDEITPQQLRAIHLDTELHKARYRDAVKAGTREHLTEERLQPLHFFIDGSTHPELFQMWSVFDAFAIGFGSPEADPRASLAEFGFEGQTLETIVHFASEYWRERQALTDRLVEEMQPAIEFFRLGRQRLGEEGFKVAAKARDTARLASATGYSVERVEKALELSEQTPAEDFAVQALPLLKELLIPADWNLFRSYLLEVQAAMMSSISTAVLGGN